MDPNILRGDLDNGLRVEFRFEMGNVINTQK